MLKKHNNWQEDWQDKSVDELRDIAKHFEKIREDEEYTLKIVKYKLTH